MGLNIPEVPVLAPDTDGVSGASRIPQYAGGPWVRRT
jgi:hypothetical protein